MGLIVEYPVIPAQAETHPCIGIAAEKMDPRLHWDDTNVSIGALVYV